jgi:hypothetical protein
MPNRIIKESICTSENVDQLSPFHETFFYRLIVNCDDYGRMDARVKILSSRLFPLKDIKSEEVQAALIALHKAGLIILYEVDGKQYLQMKTWDKHQQVRAKRSKYPSPDSSSQPSATICKQMISNDSKCPRNPIQSESNPNPYPYPNPMLDDATAAEIQHDHDRILTAAEDAGFKMSNTVRARLIALYADHGLEKMLSGFNECATHGAPTIAYLEAVLKGTGKKRPQMKVLPAQQYDQRDYSGVQAELMAEQDREMEEYMKKESS